MPRSYTFLYEHKSYQRVFVVFGVAAIAVLAILVVASYGTYLGPALHFIPGMDPLVEIVREDITQLNSRGVFYVTFLGDLFFNPLPPEVYYFGALIRGGPYVILTIVALIGAMLAHVANYLVGRRFSVFFIHLASKKSLYKARRVVNRYGAYAVIIFNVLPLPSPLLTFALGITRYNVSRLFVLLFAGNLVKYLAILGIFFLSGKFL